MSNTDFAIRRVMFNVNKYKSNLVCAAIVGIVLFVIL